MACESKELKALFDDVSSGLFNITMHAEQNIGLRWYRLEAKLSHSHVLPEVEFPEVYHKRIPTAWRFLFAQAFFLAALFPARSAGLAQTTVAFLTQTSTLPVLY